MNETLIFFKIQGRFKRYWPELYLPRQKSITNETLIFLKIKIFLKTIKTGAVFTKTEMNNEWNINFLQNKVNSKSIKSEAIFIQQKWTMNKIIFFKIWGVVKKYQDWTSIYEDKNKLWMKHLFSSEYKVFSKGIETEVVFIKTVMNNENKWNINYIQNSRQGI